MKDLNKVVQELRQVFMEKDLLFQEVRLLREFIATADHSKIKEADQLERERLLGRPIVQG